MNRFFKDKYPSIGDIVVARIDEINQVCVECFLLEYQVKSTMQLSEISRRKIRSINKLIKKGGIYYLEVLQVDATKGYIDLSKKRITEQDIECGKEKYNKSKLVNSILTGISKNCNIPVIELYPKLVWNISLKEEYQHISDLYIASINNIHLLDSFSIDPELKKLLIQNIQKYMFPKHFNFQSRVKVTCFDYQGIDAIKKALSKGKQFGTTEYPINITLYGTPIYLLTCKDNKYNNGIQKLNKAILAIKENILKNGGEYDIELEPVSVENLEK